MVNITKDEAFMLREKGRRFDVHMSKSRRPKYYLTESKKSLDILAKYRESKIVKTVE